MAENNRKLEYLIGVRRKNAIQVMNPKFPTEYFNCARHSEANGSETSVQETPVPVTKLGR